MAPDGSVRWNFKMELSGSATGRGIHRARAVDDEEEVDVGLAVGRPDRGVDVRSVLVRDPVKPRRHRRRPQPPEHRGGQLAAAGEQLELDRLPSVERGRGHRRPVRLVGPGREDQEAVVRELRRGLNICRRIKPKPSVPNRAQDRIARPPLPSAPSDPAWTVEEHVTHGEWAGARGRGGHVVDARCGPALGACCGPGW